MDRKRKSQEPSTSKPSKMNFDDLLDSQDIFPFFKMEDLSNESKQQLRDVLASGASSPQPGSSRSMAGQPSPVSFSNSFVPAGGFVINREPSPEARLLGIPNIQLFHRQPGFYVGPESHFIEPFIHIRKWKNPNTCQWEVHWMKLNINTDSSTEFVPPSRQFVTSFELEEFILKLRRIYKEVKETRTGDELPRFRFNQEAAKLNDPDLVEYWSEGIAESVSSKVLRMRPIRSKTGIYQCKIIRMYRDGLNNNRRIGIKVTMDVSTTKLFLEHLERLQTEISQDELGSVAEAASAPADDKRWFYN